jgi:hypothetical protein
MQKVIRKSQAGNLLEKVNSIKPPRSIICPDCKTTTRMRICPSCHSELPHTVGEYSDLIFSVIGAKESGKSHYIAVLLKMLKNEIGAKFHCNLLALNDDTIDRYREDFFNPVFRRGEVIQATRSARADFSIRIPLIYTLSFMRKGLFKKDRIRDVVTMVFFDTAGEDLDDKSVILTENKSIFNSSGIIFLLDPLQLPRIRAKLKGGVALPGENTEAEDLLERTAGLIREAKGLKSNQKIDIPIAVAFSKIDALDGVLDQASCLRFPSRHNGVFDVDEFEDVNSEMEARVIEWSGEAITNQLRANFNNYAFFGLTALGCNPHGSDKIAKLRPRRVEDPILWLLWKHGLVNAKKK